MFRFRGLLARFVLARAVLSRYATGTNNAQLDHCNTRELEPRVVVASATAWMAALAVRDDP